MSLSISYMGTKRKLANTVAEVMSLAKQGPMLDLFAGMCAVGEAIAPVRQVWCNDIQDFAVEMAGALFTSQESPLELVRVLDIIEQPFEKNKQSLLKRFELYVEQEKEAFLKAKPNNIIKAELKIPNCINDDKIEKERARLQRNPTTFPYRLCTITFSGGYFSQYQSIELDSIRYAIDFLLNKNLLSKEQHRWLLLSLCQAASRVATTTGHFAQFLKIKENNVQTYLNQRKRSIWDEWLRALSDASPVGTKAWRRKNLVFKSDALSCLSNLHNLRKKPSVIYADPPYTADQYSRYYHFYETLLKYDYPKAVGIGRYRPDRYTSQFSLKSRVEQNICTLIGACAVIGSDFVLSYPNNGLLERPKQRILSELKSNFRKVEVYELEHMHSSMGASKGIDKHLVTEMLFRAYQ